MMRTFHFRVFYWLVLGAVAGCSPVLAQQQAAPNAPASQADKNSAKEHQAPVDSNPFPEAKSQKAASAAGFPANAPNQNTVPQHKPTPAEANPFPEEKSRKAADAANGPAKGPSGSSSSRFDVNRLNAPAGSEARISNGEGGYIHDPQLAEKDVKVGNFYLQTRDYKGAYDRFLEATRVAPENGNAVFGLAESARGLNKTQEAITNYSIYLQAFPKGKKAKDAEKSLTELTSPRKK